MFWINKYKRNNSKKGHQITKRFLHEAWNKVQGKYVQCSYNGFKGDRRFSGPFEHLLLVEQEYRCCYCMRKLKYRNHTTFEHVLPHNCLQKDIPFYFSHINRFGHFVKYVLVSDNNKIKKIKTRPYPHFCAYENITLSCDGSIYDDGHDVNTFFEGNLHNCCNNARGTKTVLPLFFIKNIGSLIGYDDQGKIKFNEIRPKYINIKLVDDTINNLKLNHPTLQLIRKVWCLIVKNKIDIQRVYDARGENGCKRRPIIDIMLLPIVEDRKLSLPEYWNLLCQYDYFYFYYKMHNKS